MVYKGTISGISGHPMSIRWTLHFEGLDTCKIKAGAGIQALAKAFGVVEGKGDLLEKIKGRTIYYSVNALSILEKFTPADKATPSLLAAYEKEIKGVFVHISPDARVSEMVQVGLEGGKEVQK